MKPNTVGRPMDILLVEDDLVHARLAMAAIGRCQFQHRTTLVCDGEEALDFVFRRGVFHRAPWPDLVLLDLRLPKMDGLDVLTELKACEETRSIPVVIMSASEDEQDRLACEHHEVEAYLTKPLDWEKFLSLLKQLRQFWRSDMILPEAITQP